MSNRALTRLEAPGTLAPLEVQDAPVFHGTVVRAVGGAAGGALAAHVLGRLVGVAVPGGIGLIAATLAGSLSLAAIAPGSSKPRAVAHAAVGGVLGLVGTALFAMTAEWPWLGALLIGATAAPVLARGEGPSKLATTSLFAGAMAWAGLYVLKVMSGGVLAPYMPAPLATAVAGAAAGLFVGLGALPKHLGTKEDSVEVSFGRALKDADGEVREILDRSFGIYRAIRSDLSEKKGSTERQLGRQVSDLALRILHISEQCQRIQRDLGGARRGDLEKRIHELEVKASAAVDPAAKRTLRGAVENLDAQRRAVEAIERGLERVVARLHANVALLEKVRFSLVHARSADAERVGGESSPLADTIEELSRELDATSVAVGEVFSDAGELSSGESQKAQTSDVLELPDQVLADEPPSSSAAAPTSEPPKS